MSSIRFVLEKFPCASEHNEYLYSFVFGKCLLGAFDVSYHTILRLLPIFCLDYLSIEESRALNSLTIIGFVIVYVFNSINMLLCH